MGLPPLRKTAGDCTMVMGCIFSGAFYRSLLLLLHTRVLLSRFLQQREHRLPLGLGVPRSITLRLRDQPVNPSHKVGRICGIAHRCARYTYIYWTGRRVRIQVKDRILRLVAGSAQNAPSARLEWDRAVNARRVALAIHRKFLNHLLVTDDLQMIDWND